MLYRLLIIVFLALAEMPVDAASLKGVVLANELYGPTLANIQVAATDGTNGDISDSLGRFTLQFPEKHPGDKVHVIVNKDGYVVVNDLQLELALPADIGANTLQIILCKEADREEMARRFYGLKITEIDESYRRHVEGLQESLQTKEEEVRRLKQELNETRAAKSKIEQPQAEVNPEEKARRYYRLKSFEAIEESYRKRLKELEDTQQATAAALTHLQQERDQAKAAAERAAEELAKNKPSQPSVPYQQAERAFLDGRIDQALVLIDDELRLSIAQPDAVEKEVVQSTVQSWLLKAQLLTIQLRFFEAEKAYLQAIEAAPDSFEANFAFANFNQSLNRFEKAKGAYVRCLEWARRNGKDAECAQTLNNLGIIDSAQGRMEEARKEYVEALQINRELAHKNPETYLPDVAGTLNNLGNLDRDQNRLEEAGEGFEEALRINRELAQKHPDTYLSGVATTLDNLGVFHYAQNRMEEARNELDEALKLRRELAQKNPETYLPDVAVSLTNLGILDRNQGRTEAARKALEEALQLRRELAQKNPEAYLPYLAKTLNNLGILDRDQGRVEEARKALEEALQSYETVAKQDPERFSADVTKVKKRLAELPKTEGP